MKKYRVSTRNKWSFKLFKKDNNALPLNEREGHRNEMLNYVVGQDRFNFFDARFLGKVGFGVYNIKKETEERRMKYKSVALFISEDYCITPGFSWRWATWDKSSGIDEDEMDLRIKTFADKYFIDAKPNDLGIKILHGIGKSKKLKFKDEDAEQNFIKSMKDLIKKTDLLDYPTLAKRIVRATNTDLTEQQIIYVMDNYRP